MGSGPQQVSVAAGRGNRPSRPCRAATARHPTEPFTCSSIRGMIKSSLSAVCGKARQPRCRVKTSTNGWAHGWHSPLERTIMLLMRSLVYSPSRARRGACIPARRRAHRTPAWEFAATRPPVSADDRHGSGDCAPPQRWTLSGGPSDRRGCVHIGCSACLVPAEPRPPASRSSNAPGLPASATRINPQRQVSPSEPAAPAVAPGALGTSRTGSRRVALRQSPHPSRPSAKRRAHPLWIRLVPARHHFEEDQ
jgi:hypothetical protein